MAELFDGPDVAPADEARLKTQLGRVEALMRDGAWRTLKEISRASQGSEASASARLRDLRKFRFGGYLVERRRTETEGVWEYRLLAPPDDPIRQLAGPRWRATATKRIEELEAALQITLTAMQKNIAYAYRKDEWALKEGIEAARKALGKKAT